MKKVIIKLISSLLALMILLLILIKTGYLEGRVRQFLLEKISENLEVKMSIGRIRGDLFRTLVIEEIKIRTRKDGEDPLLDLPRLEIRYNLFKLLRRKLYFNSIEFFFPRLHLVKNPQGEWNFAGLFKKKGVEAESRFYFKVSKLMVRSLKMEIRQGNHSEELSIASLSGSFEVKGTHQDYKFRMTGLKVPRRSLEVVELLSQVQFEEGKVKIENLSLKTVSSQLKLQGDFYPSTSELNLLISDAQISGEELNRSFLSKRPGVAKGMAHFHGRLGGSLSDPLLKGFLTLNWGRVGGHELRELKAEMSYQRRQLVIPKFQVNWAGGVLLVLWGSI